MGGTAGQRRAEKLERESAKADASAKAKKKAEDDAYWAAAGEGSKSKAQAKREAADAAADASAASKAEARRLAKMEEEEMAGVSDVSLPFFFFLLFRSPRARLACFTSSSSCTRRSSNSFAFLPSPPPGFVFSSLFRHTQRAQYGKKPTKKKMTKAELAAQAEMDAKVGHEESAIIFSSQSHSARPKKEICRCFFHPRIFLY